MIWFGKSVVAKKLAKSGVKASRAPFQLREANLIKQEWRDGRIQGSSTISVCLLFKYRFYLVSFRERGREGEREGEKRRCVREILSGCFSHAPDWGPGLQPRHLH